MSSTRMTRRTLLGFGSDEAQLTDYDTAEVEALGCFCTTVTVAAGKDSESLRFTGTGEALPIQGR